VAPAWVNTPAIAALVEQGYLDPAPVEQRTPMGRFADPREIGEVFEFLASDRASFVTGTVVKADGGMTVQFPLPKDTPA
jgi:NAD(P)-dependent dehydrogenase (short-subunit alcohol dehydrogenase family)